MFELENPQAEEGFEGVEDAGVVQLVTALQNPDEFEHDGQADKEVSILRLDFSEKIADEVGLLYIVEGDKAYQDIGVDCLHVCFLKRERTTSFISSRLNFLETLSLRQPKAFAIEVLRGTI